MRWLIILGILFPWVSFSQEKNLIDTSYVLRLSERAQKSYNKNVDSILVYGREALRLSQKLNYKKGELLGYYSMGDHYSLKGSYDSALYFYKKSLSLASQYKMEWHYALATVGIGNVYNTIGDGITAANYYNEALAIDLKINHYSGAASCYNNLGIIYRDTKQYDEAINAFKDAINYYQKEKKTVSAAGAYSNMATVYQILKDYKKSLDYSRKAFHLFDSSDTPRGRVVSLNNMAAAHFRLDSIDLAEAEYLRSMEISRPNGFATSLMSSLSGLSYCYKHQKQFDKALKYLSEGITLGRNRKVSLQLIEMYDSLGALNESIGNYREANRAYKKVMQMRDSFDVAATAKEISNLKIRYEVEKKDSEIKLLQEERSAAKIKQYLYFSIPLIGLIISILLYRQQVIKNSRDNILMKHKEELLRINYTKKITESELMTLRTQLNPHFIFNCLNSINAFILKSDPQKSSEMLIKFAHLVRMILEMSDKRMILFEDEIKLMTLYVDLERLRSNGLFTIEMIVDERIVAKSIEVPSLIAQPFVENATLHAFEERSENNLIRINYFLEDDNLICTVEDNGVGRSGTKRPTQDAALKKKSMGISISEQRLQLLRPSPDVKNLIVINDLYNETYEPCGTRVVIKIPFQHVN